MKFFKFLLGRSPRLRRLLISSVFGGAISGLSGVALIALINKALEKPDADLATMGWIFAGLTLVATVARIVAMYLLTSLGQELVYELRMKLCRQVISSPLRQLEKMGANRVLATLTDDINALLMAMMNMPAIAVNATICLGAFGYMAYLSWQLFLVFIVLLIVGAASYQLPMMFGMQRFQEAREQQDTLFGHFRALTSGLKELKLNRDRREAFDGLLEGTAKQLRDLFIQATLTYHAAAAWGQMLFFVVIGMLLFARPASFSPDTQTLVGFTLLLLYLVAPLQIMLNAIPTLQRAEVALNKLRALDFELEEHREPVKEQGLVLSSFKHLELIDVEHAYHREGPGGGEFTLGPLSLTLQPGETVFLVGGNGSGKTTLAKVIAGLYPPEKGQILVDGGVINEDDADGYRQLFSVVFDDFHLFEELIGASGEVDEDARRYLNDLQIGHKVKVEDGRLSTIALSLGQRKRLALLTAYLEDRSIYLFDEWAADQDPVFKEIFYRQILPQLKARGKLVIAITHDDRYFDQADRVLKLENGQLLQTKSTNEIVTPV